MRIGLFDSGIGGLNVLKEFIKKYLNNEYIYYGDTKNVPYGDKDKDELLKLSTNIIRFFERKHVSLIIIACGTVSSNCYLELQKLTKIKIIDIITPTINYLKKSNFNKVLLLGTKRTVESHIFKNNINNIVEVKTPEFVLMIENNSIDSKVIENYLVNYRDYDAIVLGCTHYPLLTSEIKKYVSSNTLLIDMGYVLVNNLDITNNSNYKLELYFSKLNDEIENNIKKIIKSDYVIYNVNDL